MSCPSVNFGLRISSAWLLSLPVFGEDGAPVPPETVATMGRSHRLSSVSSLSSSTSQVFSTGL